MALYRPAGLSDNEYSDDGDFSFLDRPRYILNKRNEEEETRKRHEARLLSAILHGDVQEVDKGITEDFNNLVDFKFNHGWTPLLQACLHGQPAIVKFLLDKGADPNAHNDAVTPIMLICSNTTAKDEELCSIIANLIEKGSILNLGDRHGMTPLMRAVKNGRTRAVEMLLDKNVNIEMRDQQGWTAVFWAVHNNQSEILEMLIVRGARLSEVDVSNRTLLDIAYLHEHTDTIEILRKHLNLVEELNENKIDVDDSTSWHDYYPGLRSNDKPTYWKELSHLLYGMNCESLAPILLKNKVDLKTFLLLEEEDMIKLGIEMQYERRRVKQGLRSFHMKNWKLSAVAGLYSQQADSYSIVDCLTFLGTHLLQIYIMDASVQYTLREFNKVSAQLKFESPDSPVVYKIASAVKKMTCNIKKLKKEIEDMHATHVTILSKNPKPTGLINTSETYEMALRTTTGLVIVFSVGLAMYRFVYKGSISSM